MGTARYTPEEVAEAIRAARGIKVAAARALRCDRKTIDRYIKKHAVVREACEEAREVLVDRAEAQLIAAVDAGEWKAVKYTLETLGKERGYSEREERAPALSNEDEWLDFGECVRKVYGGGPQQPAAGDRQEAEG